MRSPFGSQRQPNSAYAQVAGLVVGKFLIIGARVASVIMTSP